MSKDEFILQAAANNLKELQRSIVTGRISVKRAVGQSLEGACILADCFKWPREKYKGNGDGIDVEATEALRHEK